MGPRVKRPLNKPSVRSEDADAKERSNSAVTPSPKIQQAILDVFRQAFPIPNTDDLKVAIQDVKSHLYQRDFLGAFDKPEYREAYALRWSAARALGYAQVFSTLNVEHGWDSRLSAHPLDGSADSSARPRLSAVSKMVCIGGGAGAEVVAIAATVRAFSTCPKWEIVAVDIAEWSNILSSLERALKTPPQLSPYASSAAKAANEALIAPDRMSVTFLHQDILACDEVSLSTIFTGVCLCTIMFTLNELFTSSISRTTAFLLALTETIQSGAKLLVIDSPGSYSEITLGQERKTKQYPMKWLLDHTLLEVVGNNGNESPKWKKIISNDSTWYRVPSGLKYPIELENMRYQIHMYEKQ